MTGTDHLDRFLARLKERYGLDPRALSLMRIGIALVLLFDLGIRASSLTAFYTSGGAVPFEGVARLYWEKGYFSLYRYSDAYWYAVTLFAVTAIVYFCVLLGYRTRVFTFLAWVLLTSLQNRNTLILQGGDDELRLLLFWGMFLPWGSYYSIDARRGYYANTPRKYFSVSSFGYVIFIFSVYFFSGWLKNSAEWDSREGTAVYYAFSLDQMTWPLGKALLSYPALMKFISIGVRWMEMLLPFLLLIPFRNSVFRMIFVLLIASLHICISLTLFVGLFYIISICALLGLLSPGVMDRFDSLLKLNRKEKEITPSFFEKLRQNYYYKVLLGCILFFFAALSMIWNLSTVSASGLAVSRNFFSLGYAVRLNQNWGMFAPTVLKDDGWFVLEGYKKDKNIIDINRNGKPLDLNKPASVLEYVKDDRWRKFGENYMMAQNGSIRHYYCDYVLKEWNEKHPGDHLDSLKVVYMLEITPPPGKPAKVKHEVLCGCKN